MGIVVLCLVLFTAGTALGIGAGFAGGHSYTKRNLRYRDPQLHPGRWDLDKIYNGTVTWKCLDVPFDGSEAVHLEGECLANVCTIARGTSHVDTCVCGKKRYGVFGQWS